MGSISKKKMVIVVLLSIIVDVIAQLFACIVRDSLDEMGVSLDSIIVV